MMGLGGAEYDDGIHILTESSILAADVSSTACRTEYKTYQILIVVL